MDSGRNRVVIRKTKPASTHEQRVGLILVVSIGVLAFLMGGFYLGTHLSSAYDYEYDGPPLLTIKQQQEQALLELQTTDTDGDGITNYDELYLYRTSPYLVDTDGDGVEDYAELIAGTDPNCDGELCDTVVGNEAEVVEPYVSPNDVSPGLDNLDQITAVVGSLVSGITPDEIRTLLIDAGVNESEVINLSDEEVMALYESVLQDLETSGEVDALLESAQ